MARRRPPAPLLRLLVLLSLLSASAAFARLPAIERALPPDVAAQAITDLRTEVRSRAARGQKPVVVFDVDGTLVMSGNPQIFFDPETRPLPGAVDLVKGLIEDGATVAYLTGRKARKPHERDATISQLTRLGFPMGKGTRLFLNTTRKDTFTFKEGMRPTLEKLGTPVAFLENEIRNARLFRSWYPTDVMVFRVRTYSKYPDPGRGARGIRVIKDYRTVRPAAPIAASRRTAPASSPRRRSAAPAPHAARPR